MYIYEDPALQGHPLFETSFLPISQIGFLPEVLPWAQYPHIHEDEYEIAYVSRGEGVLNLPGDTLALSEHSLALIPPQMAHFFANMPKSDTPISYYIIRFRLPETDLHLFPNMGKGQVITCNSEKVVSAARKILDAVLQAAGHDSRKIDPFTHVAAFSVMLLTEEAFRKSGRTVNTYTPVYANDILCYLQQHITEKVTMEDLSRTFNLSQSHIFRIFMKTYHTSPINYLIYCRMREARTCILNQNMTSQEIARRLAYSNPYHFIRSFEKFYGCHPDHYFEETPEFLRKYEDDSRATII